MKTGIVALCAALAISSPAWAHDKSMHQGKPTHGTVKALSGDTLSLDTEDGEVAVVLTKETKVERGEKAAGREVLVAGAQVAVFGTKVPGEGLVATEVLVGDGSAGKEHGEHGHHDMK